MSPSLRPNSSRTPQASVKPTPNGFHVRMRSPQASVKPIQNGFTLVEMLVSVSLVLLMMLLFTEMFQLFSGAVTTQQGVAENNERTRTLSTTIKGDLSKRTFQLVIPFAPGERYLGVGNDIDQRRGYFYVSENNPLDDTDDVLAFTVLSTLTLENKDETPYVGRAVSLGAPINGPQWEPNRDYEAGAYVVPQNPNGLVYRANNAGTSGASSPPWDPDPANDTTDNTITWDGQVPNPNQPDSDDGIGGNDTGISTAAEVVYFLRAGTLYRRVMLIRGNQNGDVQPTNSALAQPDLFHETANYPFNPPATGLYFQDFDYSAYYKFDAALGENQIVLHGFDALSNRISDFTTHVSLGMPYYRFGHLHRTVGDPLSGRRREFLAGTPARFIGGFTQEETSHEDFDYPRRFTAATSPMTDTGLTLAAPGRVTQFVGGSRRAEDILMTNVRSFDVKLWDEGVEDFVDVGNSRASSVLNATIKTIRNPTYGPIGATTMPSNVFDTWHPQADLNSDGIPDHAPYRPSTLGADGAAGVAGVDDDGNGIVDGAGGVIDYREVGASGSDDVPLPLRAIKITIRFEDPGTEQLRQISIVHSLVTQSGL